MNTLILIILGLGVMAAALLCLAVVVALAQEANERNRWMHSGRKEEAR